MGAAGTPVPQGFLLFCRQTKLAMEWQKLATTSCLKLRERSHTLVCENSHAARTSGTPSAKRGNKLPPAPSAPLLFAPAPCMARQRVIRLLILGVVDLAWQAEGTNPTVKSAIPAGATRATPMRGRERRGKMRDSKVLIPVSGKAASAQVGKTPTRQQAATAGRDSARAGQGQASMQAAPGISGEAAQEQLSPAHAP